MEDLFETQLKTLVENASETKKRLEHRRAELDRQIGVLEVELAAYQRTLEAYHRQSGKQASGRQDGGQVDLKELTVADGIELILRQAGGRERIAALALKLFEAAKLKNRRTANSHVRGVIIRDRRFRFVPGGWAELAGPAQLTFTGDPLTG
ncbi:MAG: hypothetical protein Q7R39_15425 [Dehalococcoidia bacterium]|nr:hypothetical protein [Dehalococcoidia bacterium]